MTTIAIDIDCYALPPGGGHRHYGAVELRWDPTDPLVVCMHTNGTRPWLLARDILAMGLETTAGAHDVIAAPDPDDATRMILTLSSPSGTVDLHLDRLDVDVFLQRTFEDVPLGKERIEFPDTVPVEWQTGEAGVA